MKRINQILVFLLLGSALTANAQKSMDNKTTTLKLTSKWDKVFPQSNKVEHRKVTFHTTSASSWLPTYTRPKA